ncbi:MAG: hypothetical protein OEN01_04895, partial [Candidatus Krumholzibacteria bacterium]|nr:hypothetical protein [Candidatus Krumholzibacteria bacterium]
MRIFVITALLVIPVVYVGYSTASAPVTLVAESNGSLTVAVHFSEPSSGVSLSSRAPGKPPIAHQRFFVAIPDNGRIRVRAGKSSYEDVHGALDTTSGKPGQPEASDTRHAWEGGFDPAEPFSVSEPFTFRKTRIVAVDCFASQVDDASNVHRRWSDYEITVDYPPMENPAAPTVIDPLVSALVVNKRFMPSPQPSRLNPSGRAAAVPDPHFSFSSNWVKIQVTDPGVYTIDGDDLQRVGVSLSSIGDPNSFRLFSGGGRQQTRDLSVAGGTYVPGNWMSECDIVVEYGGDGSFDVGDRVIFYGLGSRGWSDLYEEGAARDSYTKHLHAKDNFYYLTWDASFPGQPGRMATQLASPISGPDVMTFEERLYFEEDRVPDFTFGGDGWLWLTATEKEGAETFNLGFFTVTDLDAARAQTFRTVAIAKARRVDVDHHARYLVNGNRVAEKVWTTRGAPIESQRDRFDDGQPVVAMDSFLQEGSNFVSLNVPRDSVNSRDFMYFAWYSVFYHRMLAATDDKLFFSSPDTSATVNFQVKDFSASGSMYLFDVTDQFRPRLLSGFSETVVGGRRDVRFAADVAGGRRYFWVTTAGVLAQAKPAAITRHFPRDLRNVSTSPHMLIVTHDTFRNAAETLRQYRETNLPLVANPRVAMTTTTEI